MGTYGILILIFVAALWLYHLQVQKWFDGDENQHHLASLLIAAALDRDGVTRADVATHLARISKKGGGRRARLSHAVMLTRSEAAPDLYQKVLELSRKLS